MNDWLMAILAWLAGIALGVFFYLGLWLTVRKALPARHPGLWFALSLIVRTSLVLAGFYFVSGLEWSRLLLGLAGFVLARLLLTRRIKAGLGKGGGPNESDA